MVAEQTAEHGTHRHRATHQTLPQSWVDVLEVVDLLGGVDWDGGEVDETVPPVIT